MAKRKKTQQSFSEQLRKFIDKSELSRNQICKQSGIDPAHLHRFVHGTGNLTSETIDRIGECLKLDISIRSPARMASNWCIYKCNWKNDPRTQWQGNWDHVFVKNFNKVVRWGEEDVKGGNLLTEGKNIIAYQVDRKEIVGTARIEGVTKKGEVKVKALKKLYVKLPPLKASDDRIRELPAFKQGYISTVYAITNDDAEHLIAQCLRAKKPTR